MKIDVRLNNEDRTLTIRPGELLIEVLRSDRCFSVKRGCEDGNCGTCVVLVDGEAVNACLMLAAQVADREVVTSEGLGTVDNPHPIQAEYVHAAAVQCGFCTPGLIMATKALLDAVPNPTDTDIRERLDNNLCRCTGYTKIFDAVRNAAQVLEAGP
jgi:carbon-monoxide dehydrogenase small subunit